MRNLTNGDVSPSRVRRCSTGRSLGVGVLLALLHAGPIRAQPPQAGPAVLSGVTAKADAQGRQGLLLSFDRPAPLYSILGDGTDQPIVAFAGAVEASGLTLQPGAAALAAQVSIQPGGGVLDVQFKTASSAHLSVTPVGDRAILITLGDAAVATGVAASPSKVTLDPNEEGFEVVPLKYADVSEIVGLLTGEQGVRPNDSFTPQEPAFGSATMNTGGGAPPPAPRAPPRGNGPPAPPQGGPGGGPRLHPPAPAPFPRPTRRPRWSASRWTPPSA